MLVDGTTYATPHVFSWFAGAGHQISAPSPEPGPPGPAPTQYVFSSWSDGGPQAHGVVASTQATTYTATYSLQSVTCSFVLSPSSTGLPKTAGAGSITITANNPACPWTAQTAASWITIQPPASGNGSGSLSYSVAADTGPGRAGTITIGGATFTIVQAIDNPGFVSRLYQALLDRTVDPGGLSFWSGQLNSAALTRAQFVAQLFASAESDNAGLYLVKLYEAILRRDPDFGGWQFWFNSLRGGSRQTDILAAFLASPEFQTTYGNLSNSQFVDLVYQNVLGRAPDSGGLAFWLGELNNGTITRADLMNGFITSPEYDGNVRPRAQANLLYLALLRRSGDPAGLTGWTTALAQPAALAGVIDSFLNSAEYLARF